MPRSARSLTDWLLGARADGDVLRVDGRDDSGWGSAGTGVPGLCLACHRRVRHVCCCSHHVILVVCVFACVRARVVLVPVPVLARMYVHAHVAVQSQRTCA